LPFPGVGEAPQTGGEERRAALARGEVVTEPFDFERNGNSYVGGITTSLVKAPPEQVLTALSDVEALARVLPRTKSARLLDVKGETRRVELVQGNSIVETTYTVILSKAGPGRVVFELDRSRPHGIDDLYGYFTVTRFDAERSEVTLAAAVDIGSGLTHALFGRRVQNVILSTPHAMRAYFHGAETSDATAAVAQNSPR
jgi:carbon monoxide dehydrogenase subunit G